MYDIHISCLTSSRGSQMVDIISMGNDDTDIAYMRHKNTNNSNKI